MTIDYSRIPLTEAEARERAVLHADNDPLPRIPRSLLSSSEIEDYAKYTGMLFPFDPNSLKSASYEIHISGRIISWDSNGVRSDVEVNRGEIITLPANSITFVQVEPKFQLPNYIAIRFNLRITHVHRGLLLGTGPLVDPGFEGRLLIPLHNMTATEYRVDTGQALIWVEFTKTSFNYNKDETKTGGTRRFKDFPIDKKNMTPDDYIYKANKGNAIRSSIPAAIEKSNALAESADKSSKTAAESALKAEESARSIRRTAIIGTTVGVFIGSISLIALYLSAFSLMQNYESLATTRLTPVIVDQTSLSDRLKVAQDEISQLKGQIFLLNDQVSSLNKMIEALKHSQPEEVVAPKPSPTHGK